MAGFWITFGYWISLASAFACAALAIWFLKTPDPLAEGVDRTFRKAIAVALGFSSLWSVVQSAGLDSGFIPVLAETARTLGWLYVLHLLFRSDNGDLAQSPVRPVLLVLAAIELIQPLLQAIAERWATDPELISATFYLALLLQLLVSVGALVLVHNAFTGRVAVARRSVRHLSAALAVLWVFDLNFFTVGYLTEGFADWLIALRAAVPLVMAGLLALSSIDGASMRIKPSRAFAFQSVSLLVIGLYLVAMVAIAQSMSLLGDGNERLAQMSFVIAATVLALIVLPSQQLKARLRVTVLKHLFQHRYDYRSEWQRFAETIGKPEAAGTIAMLEERVIRAVADITESNAGLLLTPDDDGGLALAAQWQWKLVDASDVRLSADAAALLARHEFIVDLEELRAGHDRIGFAKHLPQFMADGDRAWALVPLQHFGKLVGVVLLAKPVILRQLDWEDFDLLKVVGRQLASYLAQQESQKGLMEAGQFDAFNRRMAFVMHDVKNLASQLSLLSRNAERHADNPAFRADMLVTLRNSTDKLNGMIARLSLYGPSAVDLLEPVDARALVEAVVATRSGQHRIGVTGERGLSLLANRDQLEQVLIHLVQNAIEASDAAAPIEIRLGRSGNHGSIAVIDSGCGMSVDFVRNGLFKPFVSTKAGGFGIGAFEAREQLMAMQGRLDVESREGLGSRFTLHLPLADAVAAENLEHHQHTGSAA